MESSTSYFYNAVSTSSLGFTPQFSPSVEARSPLYTVISKISKVFRPASTKVHAAKPPDVTVAKRPIIAVAIAGAAWTVSFLMFLNSSQTRRSTQLGPIRWKGCKCGMRKKSSGHCETEKCPCRAAARECDPELCVKCDARSVLFKKTCTAP